MDFTLTQWLNLAAAGAALLAFIAWALVSLLRPYRQRKGASEQELARWDSAGNTLRALLRGTVCSLVTKAEQDYGDGQGEIKKSAVLTQLLQLLPEQWRTYFDEEALGELIESGLLRAKEIWAQQEEEAA